MVAITISLKREEYLELENICKQLNISPSRFVALATKEFIRRKIENAKKEEGRSRS